MSTKSQKEELLQIAAGVIASERDRGELDQHGITLGELIVGDEAKRMLLEELEALDEAEQVKTEQIDRAESLWTKMVEQGAQEGAHGQFEALFLAGDQQIAASLVSEFNGDDGWRAEIEKAKESDGRLHIIVVTRPLVLGREVLAELATQMVNAANEYGCEFHGLRPAPRRSWWRFW